MKKITLIAAMSVLAVAASAQTKVQPRQVALNQNVPVRVIHSNPSVVIRDFVRPMPCLNNRGEVIATEMGTICLPYVPRVEGATLYELAYASSTEFVFREVTNPQANTPYVFRADNGAEKVVFVGMGDYKTSGDDVTAMAAGVEDAFVGSYRSHIVEEPVFYLSNDKIQYSDQPLYTTRFRAYFKASILPAGTVLSPDVRTRFIGANAPLDIDQLESEKESNALQISRQNVGLQQGTYQLGGKKVEVK